MSALAIVWVRIDDRLIHGQVVTAWSRECKCNHIVIANDQVAADKMMLTVLKVAAPPGMPVSALTLKRTAELYREGAFDNHRILILAKNPHDVLELVKAGVDIPLLNVGGMGGRPGSQPIYRNIHATPGDVEAFQELARLNVNVMFQIVPASEKKSLSEVLPGYARKPGGD
ncbi:MAG: PTS sugar transporter subunit IIB [Bacillota bacterium]